MEHLVQQLYHGKKRKKNKKILFLVIQVKQINPYDIPKAFRKGQKKKKMSKNRKTITNNCTPIDKPSKRTCRKL